MNPGPDVSLETPTAPGRPSYRWLKAYATVAYLAGIVILLGGGWWTYAAVKAADGNEVLVLLVGIAATLFGALTPMAIAEAIDVLLSIDKRVSNLVAADDPRTDEVTDAAVAWARDQ